MPFKNISSGEADLSPSFANFNLQTLDLLSNLDVSLELSGVFCCI